MKIKIIAIDEVEQCVNEDYKPLEVEMEYQKDTSTLKEIREKVGAPIDGITFQKYYDDGIFRFYNNTLPYIIKKNKKIEFVPRIDETLISEFIETHKIKNNIIEIEYGFPQAGGPGEVEWEILWNMVWKAIGGISTIGGAIGFIDFIKAKFSKKKPMPYEFIECLYKRDYWNHNELAEKLDINPEEAKGILKTFGYFWDNTKKMYVIDEVKKNDIKKLWIKLNI